MVISTKFHDNDQIPDYLMTDPKKKMIKTINGIKNILLKNTNALHTTKYLDLRCISILLINPLIFSIMALY